MAKTSKAQRSKAQSRNETARMDEHMRPDQQDTRADQVQDAMGGARAKAQQARQKARGKMK